MRTSRWVKIRTVFDANLWFYAGARMPVQAFGQSAVLQNGSLPTVTDPQSGSPFTDIGAWEFVADRLEDGQEIEPVQLDKPPGVTGYVLIIPLAGRQLYVKLQLGSGKVIGRSFHYSNNSQEQHSIRD